MPAYAAMALFSVGCAVAADPHHVDEDVGQAIQGIIKGQPSGADHDAVVIVARFEDGVRRGLCSGTLVAANLVLTARHCVSVADGTVGCGTDGQPLLGGTLHGDRPPGELAIFLGESGVSAPPTSEGAADARGAKLVVAETSTLCNADLAFVVLDRSLDAPIASLRLGSATPDDVLTAIGWGITEEGTLPAARQERSALTWIGAGPMLYPSSDHYGIGDSEFMVGESVCSGDSGGPALAASGAVVGVASRAGNGKPRDPSNLASPCLGETAHAVYAHLGQAADLVTRAFDEAGTTPRLEERTRDGHVLCEGRPCDELPGRQPARTPSPFGFSPYEAPSQPAAEASGCSASAAPREGAVEHALGVVALLGMLARIRRRRASPVGEEPG
jgi:MYXO-CTERM domain-containing protein